MLFQKDEFIHPCLRAMLGPRGRRDVGLVARPVVVFPHNKLHWKKNKKN
jgi:hypothetical protein